MAKTLAIDWDKNEVRFVTARIRSGGITLEEVVSVDLPVEEEKTNATLEKQVAEAIRTETKKRGWTGASTTICVGRSATEVQVLKMPPAPDEELPDMVRFQAMREFSSFTEDSTVDFVPLGKNDEGQLEVLAAALSAKQMRLHRKLAEQADFDLKCLQLGPVATGGLLASQPGLGDKGFLVIELSVDSVDLIVVKNQKVIFTRATNLPGEPLSETQLKSLRGEVRRTLMAARMKLDQQALDQIVILGDAQMHPIRDLLKEDFGIEIFVVNPFELAHITATDISLPSQVGGFAPLLAALVSQASGTAPVLDFLNPRRRPAPVDRGSMIRIGVLGTVAACLLVGFVIWFSLNQMDTKIKDMKKRLATLQTSNKEMTKEQQAIEEVDQWLSSKVEWLDELHYLSKKLPEADDAILTRLNFQANVAKGGGAITMSGFLSDSTVVSQMEESLQDDRRKVSVNEDKRSHYLDVYSWEFKQTITILPDEDVEHFDDFPAEGDTEVVDSDNQGTTDADDKLALAGEGK